MASLLLMLGGRTRRDLVGNTADQGTHLIVGFTDGTDHEPRNHRAKRSSNCLRACLGNQEEAMMTRGGSPRMGEQLNKSFHDRSILDSNTC
jgi:hypothetical protein